VSPKWAWSGSREHCQLRKFHHSKSSVYKWYPQPVRGRFVYDIYRTTEATRSRHGWVHMFITHRPTVTLQLHNFDLFRTCRTSSFCTVAWQLATFQLTRRIARSLGDSWASCFGIGITNDCRQVDGKLPVIHMSLLRLGFPEQSRPATALCIDDPVAIDERNATLYLHPLDSFLEEPFRAVLAEGRVVTLCTPCPRVRQKIKRWMLLGHSCVYATAIFLTRTTCKMFVKNTGPKQTRRQN